MKFKIFAFTNDLTLRTALPETYQYLKILWKRETSFLSQSFDSTRSHFVLSFLLLSFFLLLFFKESGQVGAAMSIITLNMTTFRKVFIKCYNIYSGTSSFFSGIIFSIVIIVIFSIFYCDNCVIFTWLRTSSID